MTACPTRFVRSVVNTMQTWVMIGMAIIPATSQTRSCKSTVATPSAPTWIALSSTSRRRNGGMTPRAAERKIRPQASASRSLYGARSRTMRRKFALRTAGSSGRSTGPFEEPKPWKRLPGILSER